MKKLLLSSILLGITSVMAIGATTAYFSDTEISSANTFTAGTLELDVEGIDSATESYTFQNIKPGDSAGWEGVTSPWKPGLLWTIQNTGTLDGTLTVSVQNIVQDPLAPLTTKLRPQVRVNGTWKTESSGFHNLNPFTVDLDAGESATVAIAWSFDANAGNEYQGASAALDIVFELEQK